MAPDIDGKVAKLVVDEASLLRNESPDVGEEPVSGGDRSTSSKKAVPKASGVSVLVVADGDVSNVVSNAEVEYPSVVAPDSSSSGPVDQIQDIPTAVTCGS